MIGYFVFYGLLAAVVFAATTLHTEQQVLSCTDSDGGLNYNVDGNISGNDLNGTPYYFSDRCKDSDVLKEGACRVDNGTVYAQIWFHNCSDENKTCSNGRCV